MLAIFDSEKGDPGEKMTAEGPELLRQGREGGGGGFYFAFIFFFLG